MTSAAVRNAQKEGFQTTGLTSRGSWDKDSLLAHADEYRVMGNKVRILLNRDETQFRDRKDVHTYYVVMVKYSEQYLNWQKETRARHEMERRHLALKRMADECTLEEIQIMLKYKVDSIVLHDHEAVAGTDSPDSEVN